MKTVLSFDLFFNKFWHEIKVITYGIQKLNAAEWGESPLLFTKCTAAFPLRLMDAIHVKFQVILLKFGNSTFHKNMKLEELILSINRRQSLFSAVGLSTGKSDICRSACSTSR